jgi:predicted enzyme related to lactoylglutathione lyase
MVSWSTAKFKWFLKDRGKEARNLHKSGADLGYEACNIAVMATETLDQQSLAQGKTFVWHEVYGPSAQASVDFYTNALDFGTQTMDSPMGPYHMLTRNGTPVAGVMSTDAMQMPDVPAHWATYIAVDDVDARLAKCKELGAKVVVEPMDIPSIGRMALIQDPQGAHVWIFRGAM